MRRKILISITVVVACALILSGIFLSIYLTGFYNNEVEQRLQIYADVVKYQIENTDMNDIDYEELSKSYALRFSGENIDINSALKTRITIIDKNGKVLGDSETPAANMNNHLYREEVSEALNGEIGTAIRESATLDMHFYYLAIASENNEIVIRIAVPLVDYNVFRTNILLIISLGIIVSFILSIISAIMISKNISKPIIELNKVTSLISEGNYSIRSNINRKDEIGELSNSFNIMTEKLDNTIIELKEKTIQLKAIMHNMTDGLIAIDNKDNVILINKAAAKILDISDLNISENTNILDVIRVPSIIKAFHVSKEKNIVVKDEYFISDKGRKVEFITDSFSVNNNNEYGAMIILKDVTDIRKLENIRKEFVSNVTHELKTPLTSILGFIETLKNGAIHNEDDAIKFLEIIEIETERLKLLINDILQLSEIENLKSDLENEDVNMTKLIEETVEFMKKQSNSMGISIEFNVENNINLKGNKHRYKQILINLIDNAIKYNKKNGEVNVKLYQEKESVFVEVSDTGIGIDENNINRIFERFYRVDKGRSRQVGGTGLGLAIVKHIVSLYNGDIDVKSTIREGTTFTIIFKK